MKERRDSEPETPADKSNERDTGGGEREEREGWREGGRRCQVEE